MCSDDRGETCEHITDRSQAWQPSDDQRGYRPGDEEGKRDDWQIYGQQPEQIMADGCKSGGQVYADAHLREIRQNRLCGRNGRQHVGHHHRGEVPTDVSQHYPFTINSKSFIMTRSSLYENPGGIEGY